MNIEMRNSARVIYLLLNLVLFLVLASSANSFSYLYWVSIMLGAGFLFASARIIFKWKGYRAKAVSVAFFALACVLDLLFLVDALRIYKVDLSAISREEYLVPVLLLLLLNVFACSFDLAFKLFKSRKQTAYMVAFSLYLLIMIGALLANAYMQLFIADAVLSAVLFIPISELLIISIKTYKKAIRKHQKRVARQQIAGCGTDARKGEGKKLLKF